MSARISEDVRANVVRLVKMGWTYPMVAEELGISVNSVMGICHQAGVRSEYQGTKRKRDQHDEQEARAAEEFYLTRRHHYTRRRREPST